MIRTTMNRLLCAGVALGLWAGAAAADTMPPKEPEKKAAEPEEKCNYLLHRPDPHHTMERAGHPDHFSKWAKPSITCRFDGGWVGGGGCGLVGKGCEPRYPHEGVWGWDYVGGKLLRHRVFLCWNHGRRYQAGPGQYQPDGPEFPRPPHFPEIGGNKKKKCEEE
jgi:hypothetical protein